MISFSQLLQDKKETKAAYQGPERRNHRRLVLRCTPGELLFDRNRVTCEVIDFSMNGCRIQVDKRFTAGALAQVEITTTIQGQAIRIYGVTAWTRQDRILGIRFSHPSATVRMQLENLACALFEQADAAEANEVDGSALPGQGAIVPEPEPDCPCEPDEPAERFSPEFIQMIHSGSCRAVSWEEGEWPVDVKYISDRTVIDGSILDLSVKGCSIQTVKPFNGPFDEAVELSFRLNGLPFLLAGRPVALDSPTVLGIQLSSMSPRRVDELKTLIGELRASGQYQPDMQRTEQAAAQAPANDQTVVAQTATSGREEKDAALAELLNPPAEDAGNDHAFWSDLKKNSWD